MKKSIILLSLCIGAQAPHIQAGMSSRIKAAAAIGVICLAGFSIYKLIRAYCLTDEQLLNKGEELLARGNQYKQTVSHLAIHPIHSAAGVSEKVLSILGDNYETLDGIARLIPLLKNHSERLIKRILSAEGKNDLALEPLVDRMKKQQKQIQACMSDLDLFAQIHSLHADYFSLNSVRLKLLSEYQKEVTIVDNQNADHLKAEKMLSEIVVEKNRTESHPFVTYCDRIKRNIQQFQTKIRFSPSQYTLLAGLCNGLLGKLDKISTIVQADQHYSFELYRKEQEARDHHQQLLMSRLVSLSEQQNRLLSSHAKPPASTPVNSRAPGSY